LNEYRGAYAALYYTGSHLSAETPAEGKHKDKIKPQHLNYTTAYPERTVT